MLKTTRIVRTCFGRSRSRTCKADRSRRHGRLSNILGRRARRRLGHTWRRRNGGHLRRRIARTCRRQCLNRAPSVRSCTMRHSRVFATTARAVRPGNIAHMREPTISPLAALLSIEIAANGQHLTRDLDNIGTTSSRLFLHPGGPSFLEAVYGLKS